MGTINNDYLGKHKKFRTDSKKLATVFLISAFVVAIIVFWWLKLVGITVTGEAFCGVDEHTHSDECYVSEIICGYGETEASEQSLQESTSAEEVSAQEEITTSEETATTEDTVISEETTVNTETETSQSKSEESQMSSSQQASTEHIHSQGCYKKNLSCSKAEHTHTQDCFPDKTADVETVSDWLSTIEDVEITNNIPENLIAVAMTQVGYEESQQNFELDSDGNKNGYTRYGEWYGNPYGKWNTMFVSFCLHYSNINNVDELKASGAEAMILAWQGKGVYSSIDEHIPQRGDIVFLDSNSDKASDTVGIVLTVDEDGVVAVFGDSNGSVEVLNVDADSIVGYGLTGELFFAEDKEYKTETTKSSEELTESETTAEPLKLFSSGKSDIIYTSHLEDEVVNAVIKTEDGQIIGDGSTVYIGQSYIVSIEFSEINSRNPWLQFEHDENGELTYNIPENLHCEPFTSWHLISAVTETGTVQDVGEYFVDENGLLRVRFFTDSNGVNFVDKYSNVNFNVDFSATVSSTQSGTSEEVVFNDKIEVKLELDGSAGMTVEKTHGDYDSDAHTMEYTIKVEATHGVVKDLVIDDQIWENHYTLRDTIVVTDLEGNPINPQPVVSNHPSHNSGADEGFRISGFPDFSAGDGFLIKYKTQIYDEMLGNDTVDMWNGLDTNGKDSNGNNIYKWTDDWLRVELEKMEKEGRQSVLEDADGNPVSVIEWEVEIKKDNHNLQGTVIIDTLGEGLTYYEDKDIRVKCYDEWGNRLPDVYVSWDDVTVNGNTMSFPLPNGYAFDIIYYTTYEDLDEGEKKHYTNIVSATINGKYETAGGEADVIGFIPNVKKSASGNDGEYVYFTIEADVPAVIKDWGHFFLTDLAAFWGYDNAEGYLYVENIPQDLVITAVTKSGRTINFTPYVPGGPIENTFILVTPAEGTQHHSFNILFNTSEATFEASKWILDEDAVLTVTYKLPFDSKTGTNWEGELNGDKTLEDVLLEGKRMANEAYLNYTDIIRGTGSTTYEYSPIITKEAVVKEDGTIDYTVVFQNTIPGTGGDEGYLNGTTTEAYFTDTFDPKLEYVPGTLKVVCIDPWRDWLWMNKYQYNGTVDGNSMHIHANQFVYAESNPEATDVGWSNLYKRTDLEQFYKWVNAGGTYIFTYQLRVKDEYLTTTEHSKLVLDNSAELLWNTDNSSGPADNTSEYETGLLDKHVVQENNKLDFDIHINRRALDILEDSDTLTIEDTMSHNLSVYWDSIKILYEKSPGEWIDFDSAVSQYDYTVTYDQISNKLTFVVPDSLHIRVDYTTLIVESGHVSVNNAVKIEGKAQVSDVIDAIFKVEEHSGGASGSIHNITLLKQDGDTDMPLPNVSFRLYGPVGDPETTVPAGAQESITTDSNITLDYIGTYTTGADGTVKIETQYLTLGGPYALVEAAPPPGYNILEKPVYFYFYEPDPDGIIQSVTTIIVAENYTYGFVLPETGGMGTLPLAIIGISLMAFPVLYSIIRRKRERRLT